MKKAGQQVSTSGQQLPGNPTTGGGEWDPLIPKSDQPTGSQSTGQQQSAEADGAINEGTASSEPDDMMMPGESVATSGGQSGETGTPGADETQGNEGSAAGGTDLPGSQSDAAGGMDPALADDIRAAQEALEQAGIALQTAGATLETASTDAELAAAEAALGRARLAVIIAGQDLLDIQDIYEGTPAEDVFREAEGSLNDANVAIVIATESIFSSRNTTPEFNIPAGGQTPGGGSELDKELDDSIAIFEGRIIDARNEVLGNTPPPTTAENIPGVAVLGGGSNTTDEGEEGSLNETDIGMGDEPSGIIESGSMPGGDEQNRKVATIQSDTPPPVPDDIPDAQGDDIVAQQLREAAIAETDPDLRDKLWEEYKRYKAAL